MAGAASNAHVFGGRRSHRSGAKVGASHRGLLWPVRAAAATLATAALVLTGMTAPAFAAPASVHEITANWAGDPVPTEAPFGQPVTAEWHVNTNDVDDPFSNEPVDNVRATLTVGNGVFTSIPAVCKTSGVTPVSEISADGITLLCNVGTVKEGTATVIQAPMRATSTDGGDLTVVGTATSDSAIAEAGPADPGPLPITYGHGMDLSLEMAPGQNAQGGVLPSRTGGERTFIKMNFSLILADGSRPGPASYTFPVTVGANIPAALTGLQWEGCVPVTTSSASTGQPFSDPTAADRTNFPGCVVGGSGTSYTVSLSNLDYTLVTTPTNDSLGQPLAAGGVYIASGTVEFSIPSPVTAITNFDFVAVPGPFTFLDGMQGADGNPDNNDSSVTLTPTGGFSNLWSGNPAGSRTAWDANLWVSPGTSEGITLPVPGIDDQDDYDERAQNDPMSLALPLYMQAQSDVWNSYQGGPQVAGVCSMNQNPAFVITAMDGGGFGTDYVNYSTARFFYTTQAIDTMTETCGEAGPSTKWIEATPAPGTSVTLPQISTDNLMNLPAGVTAVKMTWDPSVDRPGTLHGIGFVRAFGYIDPAAPTSGEGWSVGAFNAPYDLATAWPGYPVLNNWANISTIPGGADLPDSTYGPNLNGIRDAFRLQGAQGLITKAASDTTAQPGVPVTYTLQAQAQNTVTSPPPASFTVVDSLPVGMEYVAGSATPAPTSVSSDGRTLTWDFVDVTPNVFQTIRYQSQITPGTVIPPGTNLSNTAVINVPGDNRPADLPGRWAYATVTVPSASATMFGKSVDANVLSFEGDSSAWELTINSQDPIENAFTDTIDILPAVGDGRGTDIDGSYTITGVDAPAGSTVYYTSEPFASLSNDPRDASNGGTPGSVAGNTVGWSTTAIANPTAIRVIAPELAPGATQTIRIEFDTPAGSSCEAPTGDDNKPGQVLVNSASSFAGHTALPMLSSAVTEIGGCYAVNLKKYVQDADGNWHDANDVADYPSYRVGDEVTYRIVVENVGQSTVTDLDITDDLFPDGSFTVDELAAGDSETHEFTVTLAGGGNIVNTACGTAATPPDADAPTINCDPAGVIVTNYSTEKSSVPASGETVRPGDSITYTIAVTQEGDAPAAAVFTDSLTDVLDDATFDGVVTATIGTATVAGDVISWSGTIPVGQVALISYTVIVKDSAALAADGSYFLENGVDSPGCAEGGCPPVEHEVADFSVVKSSDPADGSNVEVGSEIEYTVTVSQIGEATYEDASLVDDLSDVLDDATWNGELDASAGTVGFDPATETLTWSGDLAPGDVVEITYVVTVTGTGDTHLHNVVTSDGCASQEVCETEHYTASYTTVKTANPASGTDVQVGQEIEYTITVTQSGLGQVVGQFFNDDLVDVLDDATFQNNLTATMGTATYDAATGVINWTGDLGPGDVAVVTYSVLVTGAGDTVIGNTVESPGCESPDNCLTEHKTGRYETVKTSDPASGSDVQIGETVEYTVTVTQIGEGAVEDAAFTDDLTAVLDDATWDGTLAFDGGTAFYLEPVVDWSGDLAVGDVVEITYSVTVTGDGDMALDNVVTSDGCVTAESCITEHKTGDYTVSKMSNPASGAEVPVDGVITYTVTVSHRGVGAVTDATATDDLSDVLDDAAWVGDLDADSGTATFDPATEVLDWTGDLAVGQVVTITYSVKVNAEGDMFLNNQVTPGEIGECVPAPDQTPDCKTSHLTGRFEYSKMADPIHNSDVSVGEKITYTVTGTQVGPAGVAANLTDDLSDVLDDATWNGDATASIGTVGLNGTTLTWSGDVGVGEVVTIEYSVTVTGAGNTTLENVVTGTGECVPAPDQTEDCRTIHKTGGYVYSKTANPPSGATVNTGDVVTYTVTITQRGDGAVADATVTDDLTDVLDDATWNGGESASSGAVSRAGNTLTWTGDLAVGQVVTLTYKVTVTAAGNDELLNVVTSPDERSLCDPDAVCTTRHEVPPPLAMTGGAIAWGTVFAAMLLLLGGGGALLVSRRRREAMTGD